MLIARRKFRGGCPLDIRELRVSERVLEPLLGVVVVVGGLVGRVLWIVEPVRVFDIGCQHGGHGGIA